VIVAGLGRGGGPELSRPARLQATGPVEDCLNPTGRITFAAGATSSGGGPQPLHLRSGPPDRGGRQDQPCQTRDCRPALGADALFESTRRPGIPFQERFLSHPPAAARAARGPAFFTSCFQARPQQPRALRWCRQAGNLFRRRYVVRRLILSTRIADGSPAASHASTERSSGTLRNRCNRDLPVRVFPRRTW